MHACRTSRQNQQLLERMQGAVQGNMGAAVLLRESLEDASVHVREFAWQWHLRVVHHAASWLEIETRRTAGLELLSALSQLGDRQAILSAVHGLRSSLSSCREAAVHILGQGALQSNPLAAMALEMCVRDEDKDLTTTEKILKAKDVVSTSSLDITHAFDVNLSASESESLTERSETGQELEVIHEVRQRIETEGSLSKANMDVGVVNRSPQGCARLQTMKPSIPPLTTPARTSRTCRRARRNRLSTKRPG